MTPTHRPITLETFIAAAYIYRFANPTSRVLASERKGEVFIAREGLAGRLLRWIDSRHPRVASLAVVKFFTAGIHAKRLGEDANTIDILFRSVKTASPDVAQKIDLPGSREDYSGPLTLARLRQILDRADTAAQRLPPISTPV